MQDLKKLIQNYDDLANVYDSLTNTFHHNISKYVVENNLFQELPKDFKNHKVLDSGGGTGFWSIKLAEKGFDVTLTDISKKELEVAKQKINKLGLNIKIIECNSEKTPFQNEEFDIILLCGGVISYTPHPDKLLNECNRILKKNGLLWLDFLNSLGWAIENQNECFKIDLALADEKFIQMDDWKYRARTFSIDFIEKMLLFADFKIKSKYGLILLTNSLPLEKRYSNNYDEELFEKYKEIELELSRKQDCLGASWSCCISAIKK